MAGWEDKVNQHLAQQQGQQTSPSNWESKVDQHLSQQEPDRLGSTVGNLAASGADPLSGLVFKALGNRFNNSRDEFQKDQELYNQTNKKQGEFNPTPYQQSVIMGAGSGALQPALAEGTDTILGGLKKFFAPAAARSDAIDTMKDIAGAGPKVASELDSAESAYDAKNIAPKMDQQAQLSQGRTISVNPKQFMGVSPEADAILQQHIDSNSANSIYSAPDKIDLPLEDAIKIRGHLNNATNFGKGQVYTNEVAGRIDAARKAGDSMRAAIASHPEVGSQIVDLSDQLQSDYNLKNDVLSRSDNTPIASITPGGADKASKLAQFDEKARTNLSQYGKNLKTAQDRLNVFTPSGAKKLLTLGAPREAFDMIATPVARSYDAAAQALRDSGPDAGNSLSKLYYLLRGNQGEGK